MLLRPEPVAPAQLGGRRSGTELGLLHRAARGADEMVMVAGVAANVRGAPVVDELPQRARLAQQLDGAVDGREPELRVERAGVVEELERGERTVEPDDRVEDGLALRRHPRARRERQSVLVAGGHGSSLAENDSQCQGGTGKVFPRPWQNQEDGGPSHRPAHPACPRSSSALPGPKGRRTAPVRPRRRGRSPSRFPRARAPRPRP